MSARPGWLSDEMLSAMRAAALVSRCRWSHVIQKIWKITEDDPWFDCNDDDDTWEGWITDTGRKALAAIEAEELVTDDYARECASMPPDGVAPNSSAPVTGWTDAWPTKLGRYWFWYGSKLLSGLVSGQVIALDGGSLLYLADGDGVDAADWPDAMWHPAEQPPEPPKATP